MDFIVALLALISANNDAPPAPPIPGKPNFGTVWAGFFSSSSSAVSSALLESTTSTPLAGDFRPSIDGLSNSFGDFRPSGFSISRAGDFLPGSPWDFASSSLAGDFRSSGVDGVERRGATGLRSSISFCDPPRLGASGLLGWLGDFLEKKLLMPAAKLEGQEQTCITIYIHYKVWDEIT